MHRDIHRNPPPMTPSYKTGPLDSSWKPIVSTFCSDTSSHPDNTINTPDFTPLDTPPPGKASPNLRLLEQATNMDDLAKTGDAKVEGTKGEEVAQPQATTAKEEKAQAPGKKACKNHTHEKKQKTPKKSKHSKGKKNASSDSESSVSSSSSSSSSSESEESESSSDSSDEEDESAKKKNKKKAQKLKEKKKAKKAKEKRRQKKADSSDDSDSSSDSSSDEEESRRLKRKKAKARAKKRAEEAAAEEEDEGNDDDPDAAEAQLAQLAQLRALERRRVFRSRPGRVPAETIIKSTDGKLRKKKKKLDPKHPDYFRADELWDKTIHDYKLTETADRTGEEEFGKSGEQSLFQRILDPVHLYPNS